MLGRGTPARTMACVGSRIGCSSARSAASHAPSLSRHLSANWQRFWPLLMPSVNGVVPKRMLASTSTAGPGTPRAQVSPAATRLFPLGRYAPATAITTPRLALGLLLAEVAADAPVTVPRGSRLGEERLCAACRWRQTAIEVRSPASA